MKKIINLIAIVMCAFIVVAIINCWCKGVYRWNNAHRSYHGHSK